MKKYFFLILGILLVLPLISACKPNNAFTVGDDINICTGNCTYQNSSNLLQFLDCDDNVECKLIAFYPNNTLIEAYKTMTRRGNVFNYSLGFLNTTGDYTAQILCYADKGWKNERFTFTISSAPPPAPSPGIGGRRPEEEPEIIIEAKPTEGKIEEIIENIKDMLKQIGGWISPKYPYIGILIIVIVIIVIYVISVRYKEGILEKIEKGERRRKFKPQRLYE